MSAIFADSFYFIALLNPSDQYHAAAIRAAEAIQSPVITTPWVLVEVADALSTPRFRIEVARFIREIQDDPGIAIVAPEAFWLSRGLDLYSRRIDKSWSLTDCISFVVMAEQALSTALTGDHHFEQAGFRAILRDN